MERIGIARALFTLRRVFPLQCSLPLQKLPKNVGDLGKLIVAESFKKLPKVQ